MKHSTLYTLLYLMLYSITAYTQDSTTKYLNADLIIVPQLAQASYIAKVIKQGNQYNATVYYGNQNIAFTGSYHDKKLKVYNGTFTYYYASTGRLMSIINYNYNVQHGVQQSWYENKQKRDSGTVYYSKKIGIWRTWHSNGQVASIGSYADSFAIPASLNRVADSGVRASTLQSFIQQSYLNEYKIHLWLTYYNNGQLKDSTTYHNGDKVGISTAYYKDGILWGKGKYKLNLEDSLWQWYHPNGMLASKEYYLKGKLIDVACYALDGKPMQGFCKTKRAAIFEQGNTSIEKYLAKQCTYPEAAKQYKHQGLVLVTFTINTQGTVEDIVIEQSPTIYFNKSIEDALYKMPKWQPAIAHNMAVPYRVTTQVLFSLE